MVEWELILQKNGSNAKDDPPTSIKDISFGMFKDNFFVKEDINGNKDYSAVNDFCKYYIKDESSSYKKQAKKLANRLQDDGYQDNLFKKLNSKEGSVQQKEQLITDLRDSNSSDEIANMMNEQDSKKAKNKHIFNSLYDNMCLSWNDVSHNLLEDKSINNVYENNTRISDISFCGSDYLLHDSIGIDNILSSFYSNVNQREKSEWNRHWSKVNDINTKEQLRDKLEKFYIQGGNGCGNNVGWDDVSRNLFDRNMFKRFCHKYELDETNTESTYNNDIINDVSNSFATGYYKNLWINHLSDSVRKNKYDSFWKEHCISEIKGGSRYYNTISEKDNEVRNFNTRYFEHENDFLNTNLTTNSDKESLLRRINATIRDVDMAKQKYKDGGSGALTSDQQIKQSSRLYNNTLKEILNLVMCIIILCYYIAKITNVFKMNSISSVKDDVNNIAKNVAKNIKKEPLVKPQPKQNKPK